MHVKLLFQKFCLLLDLDPLNKKEYTKILKVNLYDITITTEKLPKSKYYSSC